jgi:phage major head subunit gpT-like protein
MTTTNISNFANCGAFYKNLFEQFWGGKSEAEQNYLKYCFVDNQAKPSYEFAFLDSLCLPRKWVGNKIFKPARAQKFRIDAAPFEASIPVAKIDYDLNQEFVGQGIRFWLSQQRNYINSSVVENVVFACNTDLAYDGVALISDSHTMDDGSTQDNKTTSALSLTTYRAAKTAMQSFKDPSGNVLGIRPMILLVGPALEDLAREITEGKLRTQGITAASGVDPSASGVAAAAIENIHSRDGVQVVVEPLFADGTHNNWWFLIGAPPGGKPAPFVVNVAQAPTPTDDVEQFKSGNAVHKFSVEAVMANGNGLWQHIYGGIVSV